MTKTNFPARAEARYDALQKLNSDELSFYAYEEQFTRLRTELGREVIEENLGAGTGRKKNASTLEIQLVVNLLHRVIDRECATCAFPDSRVINRPALQKLT